MVAQTESCGSAHRRENLEGGDRFASGHPLAIQVATASQPRGANCDGGPDSAEQAEQVLRQQAELKA